MQVHRLFLSLAVWGMVFAALVPAAGGSSPAAAEPCPSATRVEHVGLACQAGPGLLALFAEDGAFLGYSHGADHDHGPAGPGTFAASVPPMCVTNPTASDYYTKVIYARPSDVPDAYATKKGTITTTIANANGLIGEAAAATGGEAGFKVECTAGAARVYNVALGLTRAQAASFNDVVSDLQSKGFTGVNAKNWVFVDGGASDICLCGVGHRYEDDRLILNNWNNGAPGSVPMFAVSWMLTSTRLALHELSHTLGAVQGSSPHTSGDGHCNDGLDTMCYADGGPTQCTSGFYCPGTCATEVYDCGKDDYFHRNPPPGSYLATKWNVGSSLNRFLAFTLTDTQPPTSSIQLAGTLGVDSWYRSAVTVTLSATDPSPGSGVAVIRHRLDGGAWADYSGPLSVSSQGAHTLEYYSQDNAGNAEATRTRAFGVDTTPPTLASISGQAACPRTAGACTGAVTYPFSASDPHSALDRVNLKWSYCGTTVGAACIPLLGSFLACTPSPAGLASATGSCTFRKGAFPPGTYEFRLEAFDRAGNSAQSDVERLVVLV